FLIELLFKGLRFKFLSIAKQKLPQIDLNSYYTTHFSERHVLYSTIKLCFKDRYVQVPGIEFKKDGGPDYYMRSGSNVFIFETKDVLIKSEIKHSGDFHLYNEAFSAKLYEDGKKKKAVVQLVNNVRNCLIDHYGMTVKQKRIKVYPVL